MAKLNFSRDPPELTMVFPSSKTKQLKTNVYYIVRKVNNKLSDDMDDIDT